MEIHELDQNQWGVCGFVAATQAAVHNEIGNVKMKATSHATLFPLIRKFCSENADIATELLDFSKLFGEKIYNYKSLGEVVNKMEPDKKMNLEVGLVMTANAMSRLCKSLSFTQYDFHGTTSTTNALDFKYKNTIYGLGKKTEKGNLRYGLQHWIYIDFEGTIMTWGDKITKEELISFEYDKVTHYLPALT